MDTPARSAGLQTILFTYLRTGGGHLAPARALAASIGRDYAGTARAVLVDGLEGGLPLVRWVLEDGYRILQAHARWYYEFLYLTNKIPAIAWANARIIAPFVKTRLRESIKRERPNRIVVAHFFLIQPILDILREKGESIPITVLVTDPYTAHPLWFRNTQVEFVLFSEELRRHCAALGINSERLAVFPFVLSEQFSAPIPAISIETVKRNLGFSPDRRMVLVLGGADGIPRGEDILRELVLNVRDADLVIVCGRNDTLLRHAEEIRDGSGRPDVTVYGYVDFAYELINSADIVISKCGASTFMEILISGKIPVITDYLWEQEKGNKDFLERTMTGFFEPRIRHLPRLINRLLTDEAFASACRSNIRGLHLRNGTPEVARWLVQSNAVNTW
jgi:UDP-N-acetylglucosamine:LPS N-acetylglucosamine transferase